MTRFFKITDAHIYCFFFFLFSFFLLLNSLYRPLSSPTKTSTSTGMISRFIEHIAPYPDCESDYDEVNLLNIARLRHDSMYEQNDDSSDEKL